MTRVLLVGLGADIGANLLQLSATGDVAHPVTDVLTHPIVSDGVGAGDRGPLDELAMRLLLAEPRLTGRISTDRAESVLAIDGRPFRIHFGDLEDPLEHLGRFDLAVLATSRRHIRSPRHLAPLEGIARVVVGVAENADLPAFYPALATAEPRHFTGGRTVDGTRFSGSLALGSCQCAGWTAGLRVLAECCEARGVLLHEALVHAEVDIVHPDTASSNFGTVRVGSRSEDPRDNLRPGVSQVAESMRRFAPATSANTVSLRVLTQPPGYQVQRYFLRHDGLDLRPEDLAEAAAALQKTDPTQLHVATIPVGSRAYAALPSSTVVLATDHHLVVRRIGDLTEVVVQAFVHNTLGYCAAILSAIDRLLEGEPITVIDAQLATTVRGNGHAGNGG